MTRRLTGAALTAVPVVVLGVFVVWPLVAVLTRSLAGVGPDRVFEVLTRPSTRRVVGFSVGQATLSTVLTLAVGLPVAALLARYRFPGRSLVRVVVVVPFVLPTVVVATAMTAVFDLVGVSTRSLGAILAAHVFFNVAVVVRVVGGHWAGVDRRLGEAARVLGAGRWQAFRLVTLPRLAPVIAGASVVVFLFTFTSFGVIRVLGGPGRATVETEIFRYAVNRAEFDVAAVLAVLQLVVVSGLAVTSAWFQRRIAVDRGRRRPLGRPVRTWGERALLAGGLTLVGVVVVAPMAVLVQRSLAVDGGYGLDHYRRLLTRGDLLPVSAVTALGTSVRFAALAAVVAVVVGLAASLTVVRGGVAGRVLDVVALIPLGVSAVTLGFGYLVAFTVLDLRRSVWIVPISHGVIGLPFVLASVAPALRSIDPRLREAAATLGASPLVIRSRIDWPLIRGAVGTGAGFAAAVSIGEFGATSFLSRGGDSFTAPMAVFRLVSQPGEALRGQAMALSVVIGAVVASIAAVVEWRRSGTVGLF